MHAEGAVSTGEQCRGVLGGGMRARTTTTNLCPSGATMRISSFGRASGGTLTTIRVESSATIGACGGMGGIGGMPGIAGGAIIIEAPGGHIPIGGVLEPAAALKLACGPGQEWLGMRCGGKPCCAAI